VYPFYRDHRVYRGRISNWRGYLHKVSNVTCARARLLAPHIVDNALLVEARPGERGEMKRMLEKELNAWSCWKGSEENHTHTTMRFLGMAFWFPILSFLGGYGGKPRQTSLRMKPTWRSCQAKRAQRPQPGQRSHTNFGDILLDCSHVGICI
jgi:hypothetical protein